MESLFLKNYEEIFRNKLQIGNYPTPLQPWNFCVEKKTYSFYIKRDDLSESSGGGNKLRKLEFILPQVLSGKHDFVLSIGPVQSNSCRVLSSITPMLNIKSAHILIHDDELSSAELKNSTEGNLFFHQLFNSILFFVSKSEYIAKGESVLLEEGRLKLIEKYGASHPFLLPMGGSTVTGALGHLECFQEIETQITQSIKKNVKEIFFACGSGGTAAGLAVGKHLSTCPYLKDTRLTGYFTWNSTPDYFHSYVDYTLNELGLGKSVQSKELVNFVNATGMKGYGKFAENEAELIKCVARTTGIVLDGTYTGKAVKKHLESFNLDTSTEAPGDEEDSITIFLHTGGIFSMIGRHDFCF